MSTDAKPGDLLAGRYRLEALLARGGMGRVWRGRDDLLGREVAVKELVVPAGVDPEEAEGLTRRTVREAQAAARLVHRNIVTVYDVVIHDDRPWIVMQLLPGSTLDQVIRTEGPLPPDRAARIALQILAALRVSHDAGVVHRDVKPGNVIVQAHDDVVLTDFGIATIEGDPTLTSSGMLLGSTAYLAPERARGEAARPESDLWSAGATLYAMVEGHPPYQRESHLATLAALVNEPPAPHRQHGLMAIVLEGLLRKDPAERMSHDLAATLLTRVASATVERAATRRTTPVPRVSVAVPPVAPDPDEPATATLAIPGGVADPAERSGTVDAATEGESGGPGRRRWAALAAAAAVVILSAVLLAGALTDQEERSPQGTGLPSPARTGRLASPAPIPSTPAASPEPQTPPAAPPEQGEPEPGTAGIPDGFRWYRDPTGFALAIPLGWTVSRQDHYVYVREPGGGRFLLIDQTDEPKDDAVADWTEQEAARRDRMRDYERIRIERVDYFLEAADWEFRYTRDGVRLHVVNRGFVTSEDQAYGLYWSTPDSRWDESTHYFEVFTRTFQPAS